VSALRMKPVIIVNPKAGGLGHNAWAKMVAPITDVLGPFDVRYTAYAGHATELARAESESRRRHLVIAAGGDGTINEVVSGLVSAPSRPGPALGIIPRGTGGDFRRCLQLSRNVAEAAARIKTAKERTIDVGLATMTASDGQQIVRPFINVASFGFSAEVARRANTSTKRFGAKASFVGATLRTLLSQDNVDVSIRINDQQPQRRTVLMAAFGNGQYFGGGMHICPEAELDDGQLDFVLVGDLSRGDILLKGHRLFAGTHTQLSAVSAAKVTQVRVDPVDPREKIPVEVDGETPGFLPATFTLQPRALRLRA